jgi:hypothetical protein
MKILVYTNNISAGEWVKETLEEFGRGMHIIVRGEDNEDILKNPFSYVITLGNLDKEIPSEKRHITFPNPVNDEDYALLRRSLWTLYRDTLRDMIGNKCSCGLYDVCHCH